jgi:5-(carboxyamino)imidazole ribonucleotide synthase
VSRRLPVIGILGGGQLARMLALAAAPLGVRCSVVDGSADACAGQLAPLRVADWRDLASLEQFAAAVDVVTFDFENVPAATAEWLRQRVPVHPSPEALAVAQDRISEKMLFRAIGLDTPAFAAVSTRSELDAAVARIGVPSILKTRRLGYDGKGQFRLRSATDVDAAWAALGAQATPHGLVLEAFVPFTRELSVLAVRGRDGEFRTWPLTQNWHHQGILALSCAPATVAPELAALALHKAQALAEKLDYVGVFALELFEHAGHLLGNEMAPRVHNSGHWTIEGAVTSQFENHVRAVLGLPLGATTLRAPSVMFNWIDALPEPVTGALALSDVHWHDYGKDPRPGRKVGHATIACADSVQLLARAQALAQALGREPQLAPALPVLHAGAAPRG